MKKLGICMLYLPMMFFSFSGGSQTIPWAVNFTASDYVSIVDIAVDNEGRILVAGTHRETLTIGNQNVDHEGSQDFFLAKFYASGELDWAVPFTGSGYDEVWDLELDDQNNIYLAGAFSEELHYSGQTVEAPYSPSNILLLKFSQSGNHIWTTTFGSTQNDVSYGLHVDAAEVLAVGHYRGEMEVAGTTLSPNGAQGMWLAGLSPNSGEVTWARGYGGIGYDRFNDVGKNSMGEIYICGSFSETFATPSVGNLFSDGGEDVFIAKFSATGDVIWMVAGQGLADLDRGTQLIVDEQDNLYVSGFFEGELTFLNTTLTGSGNRDLFIISFDSDRNIRWTYNTKTPGLSTNGRFALAANQTLYFTGTTTNGFAIGDTAISNFEDYALFLAALDYDGNLQEVYTFDGPGKDFAGPVAYRNGHVFFGGNYQDHIELTPELSLEGLAEWDGFIGKLEAGDPIQSTRKALIARGQAWFDPSNERLQLSGEAVQIWSAAGYLLREQQAFTNSGISTIGLPNGIYHLKYKSGHQWYSQSVAIIR